MDSFTTNVTYFSAMLPQGQKTGEINMSENKRENKRVLRTRASIREALIKATREKGLTRVTVTDIARLAGINRKTFYAYYDSIDDLIHKLELEIAAKLRPLIQTTNLTGDFFDTFHFFGQFGTVLNADFDTYRLFYHAGLLPHLLETIKTDLIETFLAQYDDDDPKMHTVYRLFAEYAGAGLLGSFTWWIANPDIPLTEYATTIGNVTLSAFRAVYPGQLPAGR